MTEKKHRAAEFEGRHFEWLHKSLAPWQNATFPDLILAAAVGAEVNRPAIIYREQVWTYGELASAVNTVAKNLISRYGIRHGDLVMMRMENSDFFIIDYLAIHRIGAVAVPLNTKLTERELDYQIQDAKPHLILTKDPLRTAIPCVDPEHLFAAVQQDVLLPTVRPDDVATIFYTSGTTGAPKGVIHTHRTLIAGAFQNCRGWGYEQRHSVTLAMTPLFHIAAHSWFYPVLANEGTLVVETFKTERALQLIARHKVDGFGAVPAMLLMMLEHPHRTHFDLSSVRNIRFGASSMPPDRIAALREAFPNAALYHGMGQTESGGTISVLNDEFALSKLGSSGLPIPGVAVRVVDDDGNVVARGCAGEVLARGAHVMAGYLNQPESSARTLVDGWLYTGDIGIMDDDGMITLVDRKKDMIIRAGENIYSSEIENLFLSHAAIRECAIVGLPDPLLQEVVSAVIVTDETPRAGFKEGLVAFGREHIAGFKVPVRWFFANSLPRTATGKVQKQLLRDAILAGSLTEL